MPLSKTPDGTHPDAALDLPYDGETVNHDSLMKSVTAAKGLIAKLIDRIGWIKARRAIYGRFRSTSAVVTYFARSTGSDNVTPEFTAAPNGSYIRVTFTVPMPTANYVVVPNMNTPGRTVVIPVSTRLTTHFELAVFEADAPFNTVNMGTTGDVEFEFTVHHP